MREESMRLARRRATFLESGQEEGSEVWKPRKAEVAGLMIALVKHEGSYHLDAARAEATFCRCLSAAVLVLGAREVAWKTLRGRLLALLQ